jgi:cytochrome c biogenesis protein CcmG, thiol:disulfide interchange protein DsbE
MRRWAVRVLVVLAAVGALILIVVLSGTSGSDTRRPAPQLPTEILVPPRQTLALLRGKPAAINFWASWCEPCRKETPELERLFSSLHGEARLVGVNYSDDRNSAESFIREFHVTYPILRDPDGQVGDRYGVTGLPTTAILDARGQIVQLLRGPQTEESVRLALAAARH